MSYFKISRFFTYIIPLGIILVTKSTLFPFIVGKYVWFRTISALALIFFLLGILLDKRRNFYLKRIKKIVKNPLFIAVCLFVVAFVVAGFFGVDPHFSFWSNFERGEGGLQMLHFLAFFTTMTVLFKEKKDWRTMFVMFVISSYLLILYGVGAGLGLKGFLGPQFGPNFSRFQGSVGNPAYVAIYLVFGMFFAAYLLISKFKKLGEYKKTALILSLLVFFIFFILAATRGAFLGLGAGIFVGLLYLGLSKKDWRKPVLSTLTILVILFSLGVYFQDSEFVNSLPASRVFDISLTAKTFGHRTIMWGMAWEGFLDRPVFGWGPGNYIDIFQQKYDPEYFDPQTNSYGAWFDRAHSVIFDYLSQTGIVGLLSYLSIFAVLFWQLAKTKIKKSIKAENWTKPVKALLLGLPAAYLVQGLVLFDVSTTYIPLFIFLAFIIFKKESLKTQENV